MILQKQLLLLKLFEYMAMEKPVVSTALPECLNILR